MKSFNEFYDGKLMEGIEPLPGNHKYDFDELYNTWMQTFLRHPEMSKNPKIEMIAKQYAKQNLVPSWA